jgi:hypothetical protein
VFNVASLNLKIPQKPRGNRLLVIPLLKAGAGKIIDMEEDRERPASGIVIYAGPGGVGAETGNPVPVESVVGELVSYGRYAGMDWSIRHEVNGEARDLKTYILRDTEVILAQPPGSFDLVIHDNDPGKMHEVGLTCEHCPKVEGEAGLARLREIAAGGNPDAPADLDAAINAERDRASALVTTTD